MPASSSVLIDRDKIGPLEPYQLAKLDVPKNKRIAFVVQPNIDRELALKFLTYWFQPDAVIDLFMVSENPEAYPVGSHSAHSCVGVHLLVGPAAEGYWFIEILKLVGDKHFHVLNYTPDMAEGVQRCGIG